MQVSAKFLSSLRIWWQHPVLILLLLSTFQSHYASSSPSDPPTPPTRRHSLRNNGHAQQQHNINNNHSGHNNNSSGYNSSSSNSGGETFEARFQHRFKTPQFLPPPEPYGNCAKTYPSRSQQSRKSWCRCAISITQFVTAKFACRMVNPFGTKLNLFSPPMLQWFFMFFFLLSRELRFQFPFALIPFWFAWIGFYCNNLHCINNSSGHSVGGGGGAHQRNAQGQIPLQLRHWART